MGQPGAEVMVREVMEEPYPAAFQLSLEEVLRE